MLSRLEPGQTLEARILEGLNNGRWAIRLLGQNLVAESHLPLVAGQLVQAHVHALGPPVVLTLSGLTGSEAGSIARALQDLALADDTVNRAIVKGLIGRGLPVTRDGVATIREMLIALGGAVDLQDAESLEQIVARALMLQARGLPVTPDSLQAFLSALPAGSIGGLLEGVVGLLRSLRLPGFDRAKADALAQRIQASIGSLLTMSGDSLKNLLAGLGIDLEGRLASWMLAGEDGVPNGANDTLRQALQELHQQLIGRDASALNTEGRSGLDALLGQVREAAMLLDSQQALNLPSGDREALHLQIPLLVEGQVVTTDLTLSPVIQGGRRRLDDGTFNLSLAIDLSGLGPLKISLAALDRQLACTIFSADDQRAAFILEMADEARDALEGCGYAVTGVSSRTFPKEDDGHDAPPTVGLDVRA